MRKFINRVNEIYYVRVYKEKVVVEVKMYESFWDEDQVKSGNAFHTRQEAEFIANEIRSLLSRSEQIITENRSRIGA